MTLSQPFVDPLGLYLDEVFDLPFQWGVHDCMLFPADWVLSVTGKDPAYHWRGLYDNARGASRLLDDAGGLLAAVDNAMVFFGFSLTEQPVAGDVGVVQAVTDSDRVPAMAGCAGAICIAPGRWISLRANGMLEGIAAPLRAYSIGYRG